MENQNRFRILLVDDEPEILELLRYNFSKKGLDVSVARNGEEALDIAEQDCPQVFVVDIMMPVMNGIELVKKLRAKSKFKKIPVLFLSATSDDYLVMAAMNAGGDHFVSKPVKLNLLFDLVNNLYRDYMAKGAA